MPSKPLPPEIVSADNDAYDVMRDAAAPDLHFGHEPDGDVPGKATMLFNEQLGHDGKRDFVRRTTEDADPARQAEKKAAMKALFEESLAKSQGKGMGGPKPLVCY